MPAAIIIAAVLSLVFIFQVNNSVYLPSAVKPTPTEIQAIAPTPTKPLSPTSTPTPRVTNKPVPPTPTIKVVQNDTEPPVFEWMTGPEDGMTVPWSSFCFPMKVNDNAGEVWVRYSFDSDQSPWGKDFSPCFQNVANGWHTFVAQAKDAAGNIATEHSRYFKVDVPVPNAISPMPTSIVNEPLN